MKELGKSQKSKNYSSDKESYFSCGCVEHWEYVSWMNCFFDKMDLSSDESEDILIFSEEKEYIRSRNTRKNHSNTCKHTRKENPDPRFIIGLDMYLTSEYITDDDSNHDRYQRFSVQYLRMLFYDQSYGSYDQSEEKCIGIDVVVFHQKTHKFCNASYSNQNTKKDFYQEISMDEVPCFFSFCLKNQVYKPFVDMSNTFHEFIVNSRDKCYRSSWNSWDNISCTHCKSYKKWFKLFFHGGLIRDKTKNFVMRDLIDFLFIVTFSVFFLDFNIFSLCRYLLVIRWFFDAYIKNTFYK